MMVNHGHSGCNYGYDKSEMADILIDIMSLSITAKLLFANGG